MLLDEPFAGVDPIAVNDIRQVISQLTSIGIGVLITDHNVRETLKTCDRAYVIKSGSLLASGRAEDIANNPLVKKYYFTTKFTKRFGTTISLIIFFPIIMPPVGKSGPGICFINSLIFISLFSI